MPLHKNVLEDGISGIAHSHTRPISTWPPRFTRSKFGRTGNAHRGKAGETERRNGPIGFIDSFFFSFSLSLLLSRGNYADLRGERARASVIFLMSAARGSLVKRWTLRRFGDDDDGGGFHDLANPACTRARSSQIFILIEAGAPMDHRDRRPLSLLHFFPFAPSCSFVSRHPDIPTSSGRLIPYFKNRTSNFHAKRYEMRIHEDRPTLKLSRL